MKKLFMLMVGLLAIINCSACASDNTESETDNSNGGSNVDGRELFGGKKVLIAYFSWGGTTRRMAQEIQRVTGGDIFEIVPQKPYPAEYTFRFQKDPHWQDRDCVL